jgi:hypothetical protein
VHSSEDLWQCSLQEAERLIVWEDNYQLQRCSEQANYVERVAVVDDGNGHGLVYGVECATN